MALRCTPAFLLPLEGHHFPDGEFGCLILAEILIVGDLGRDLVRQELLDGGESVNVLVAGQGISFASFPRPRGAADAVNVVLRVLRDIVVDDVGDIIDVKAPRSDIRRDEQGQFPKFEALQDAVSG